MLCQCLLYSKVNQLYSYIYPLFFKILSPYRPLQSIEQNSLCYIVGLYYLLWLSIRLSIYYLSRLSIVYLYSVCICQSQSPSLPPLPSLGMHTFIFYICGSISLNFINKSINSINLIKKFICTLLLGSTYKWDHMVFVFLCLTYFIQHDNL